MTASAPGATTPLPDAAPAQRRILTVLVAGTAMITDAVPLTTPARAQGLVEVSIATGGLRSFVLLPAIAATAKSR